MNDTKTASFFSRPAASYSIANKNSVELMKIVESTAAASAVGSDCNFVYEDKDNQRVKLKRRNFSAVQIRR
jgi:hypothetical protein